MTHDEHLQEHLAICKAVAEHLNRTGKWPWADSQISEDLVESEDKENIV